MIAANSATPLRKDFVLSLSICAMMISANRSTAYMVPMPCGAKRRARKDPSPTGWSVARRRNRTGAHAKGGRPEAVF
jgi:hypothetical protein